MRSNTVFIPQRRGNKADWKAAGYFLTGKLGVDEMHGHGKLVTGQSTLVTDVGEVPERFQRSQSGSRDYKPYIGEDTVL